jgi:hypothetical protein
MVQVQVQVQVQDMWQSEHLHLKMTILTLDACAHIIPVHVLEFVLASVHEGCGAYAGIQDTCECVKLAVCML